MLDFSTIEQTIEDAKTEATQVVEARSVYDAAKSDLAEHQVGTADKQAAVTAAAEAVSKETSDVVIKIQDAITGLQTLLTELQS